MNLKSKIKSKGRNLGILGSILVLSLCLITPSSPALAKGKVLAPNACSAVDYSNGWVARENTKVGDANWEALVSQPRPGTVSGWFDKTSVVCGDTVGLHLSGNNRDVSIKIYRMGYYNGANARLVYSTIIGKVAKASAPIITKDATHLTSTNWATTTTVNITSSFPTGIYMARFDDGGKAGYAPLVVRNDSPTPGLLIVAGDITWQAYNTWGGWSLYHGPDKSVYSPGRIVTFNRPYDRDGKSNFTIYDAGIVQTSESLGLNVNYTDDVAVSNNPSTLLGHTGIVYNGHSEYWTANMLTATNEAKDSGSNLIFLGANSAYWKTRLENNNRNIVVWKGDPGDPYTKDPSMITDKWGMGATQFNQSQLLGALYGGILKNTISYTIQDATVWPIAGTGLKTGDKIAGVVGKEIETTGVGQAPAVQSFLTAKATTVEQNITWTVGLTYYTAPSKAGVIDVGTMGWVCNITNTCPWKGTADSNTKSQVIAITKQILTAASVGPLGIAHPEVANIPARTQLVEICVLSCSGEKPVAVDTN